MIFFLRNIFLTNMRIGKSSARVGLGLGLGLAIFILLGFLTQYYVAQIHKIVNFISKTATF